MRVPGIDRDPARGKRIAEARRALGLTQTELAGKLGVAQRTLSTWENGAVLTHPNLRVLALELGTTVDYLRTGEEASEPLTLEKHDERVRDQLRVVTDRISGLEQNVAALVRVAEQTLLAIRLPEPPSGEAETRPHEEPG